MRCFRNAGPLVALLFAFPGGGSAQAPSSDVQLQSFDAAWRIVHQTHFDTTFNGVNWVALRDSLRPRAIGAPRDSVRGLIQRMLSRLGQSHFSLIPQEAAETPGGGGAGGGSGNGDPGFDIRLLERRIVVAMLDAGGPAAQAGVRPGWTVEVVDSHRVEPMLARLAERRGRYRDEVRAWGQVRAWLVGQPGTKVTVNFRDEADRPVQRILVRQQEPGLPVKFGDLPTFYARFASREVRSGTAPALRVGVIEFNTWMVPLIRQVDSAVDALRAADGIVLDLRGNRGGVAGMVIGVAGHFTPRRDTLGLFRSRTTTLRIIANPRTVSPTGRPVQTFAGPVAILIDDMSGSASEVFAGGMQAAGLVRVFGSTSLGGVLPASWDKLPNGDILYHAIADFVTSKGVVLEGRGVIPDEPVSVTRADLLAGRDPVLDAAVRWIQQSARSNGGKP